MLKFFNHYYGTSKEYVLQQQEIGKPVILVIDTQGPCSLKISTFRPHLFLYKSSFFTELRERLFKEKNGKSELIEQRLSWAIEELNMALLV